MYFKDLKVGDKLLGSGFSVRSGMIRHEVVKTTHKTVVTNIPHWGKKSWIHSDIIGNALFVLDEEVEEEIRKINEEISEVNKKLYGKRRELVAKLDRITFEEESE